MTAVAWIALAGLLAACTQLFFLNRHTAEFAKQAAASVEAAKATSDAVNASVHITMAQMMIEIDRVFLERPSLRAQFYGRPDGKAGAGQVDHREQETQAAAEMLIDFVECFLGHRNYMPDEFTSYWRAYFSDLMSRSDAFRDFWDQNRDWYGGVVHEFLDPLRQAA
ncbi:hypothetical protein ABZT03_02035 [Streptomyces sp. NPDC005574]|uniref:hypothetical protein n=1 Tax=Streptomyces sp. NPDC005574 TaxID=3156891 RepID=UPI0033A0125C